MRTKDILKLCDDGLVKSMLWNDCNQIARETRAIGKIPYDFVNFDAKLMKCEVDIPMLLDHIQTRLTQSYNISKQDDNEKPIQNELHRLFRLFEGME